MNQSIQIGIIFKADEEAQEDDSLQAALVAQVRQVKYQELIGAFLNDCNRSNKSQDSRPAP